MFASLGFLYPGLLILAPLAGAALIYVYLRRGQGKKLKVASLLLLKSFESTSISRKKFFPPPRFFLELLILLLLILGAAGLFFQKEASQIAIVIDNSFSMSAIDSGDVTGRSLLELAKLTAIEEGRRDYADQSVDIYITSPSLLLISSAPITSASAQSDLERVSFSYSGDNLQNALSKLESRGNYERVLVYTDQILQTQSTSAEDSKLQLSTVGQGSHQNMALSSFSFQKDPLSDDRGSFQVVINSYARHEAPVTVELFGVAFSGSDFIMDLLESRDLLIQAESQEVAEFEISEHQHELYHARFRVRNEQGAERLDSISHDNYAWLSTRSQGQRMTLVGPLSPESLKLNNLQEVQFHYLTPEEYRALAQSGELPETQGYIFHRFAPAEQAEANSLIIAPQSSGSFIARDRPAERSEITRWNEAHPVNSYLNLSLLTLRNHASLQVPYWAEEIVASTSGPAAIAGELSGHRVLATGFELFPYEGRASPVLSILTLNSIRWILNQNISFGSIRTYQPLLSDPSSAVVHFGADALTNSKSERSSPEGSLSLTRPGLYKYSALNQDTLVAVNFFDEQESNTQVQRQLVPIGQADFSDTAEDKTNFMALIILVALMLLLIDMIFAVKGGGFPGLKSFTALRRTRRAT